MWPRFWTLLQNMGKRGILAYLGGVAVGVGVLWTALSITLDFDTSRQAEIGWAPAPANKTDLEQERRRAAALERDRQEALRQERTQAEQEALNRQLALEQERRRHDELPAEQTRRLA